MRLFMVALTMLITTSAHASVIFEDNFDSHADWSPTQGGGSDSEHCSTGDCSIPSRYDGWRQNGTSVPGGHNSLNINGANKRGASGKALTIYSESVGDWTNDALLDLKLADENNG